MMPPTEFSYRADAEPRITSIRSISPVVRLDQSTKVSAPAVGAVIGRPLMATWNRLSSNPRIMTICCGSAPPVVWMTSIPDMCLRTSSTLSTEPLYSNCVKSITVLVGSRATAPA